jgi:hypothetical protein
MLKFMHQATWLSQALSGEFASFEFTISKQPRGVMLASFWLYTDVDRKFDIQITMHIHYSRKKHING